jgi:hypothetical protein
MTDDGKAALHAAIIPSRNWQESLRWREPGATIVPILPPSRRPWWRRVLRFWF